MQLLFCFFTFFLTQEGSNTTQNAINVIDSVMPVLLAGMLPGEKPLRITSDSIALEVTKHAPGKIRKEISTMQGGKLKLPDNLFQFDNQSFVVNSKVKYLLIEKNFFDFLNLQKLHKSSVSTPY